MMDETYHVPVLLEESIAGLNIRQDGTYVDVTFGGGGHSKRILQSLGDGGHRLASTRMPTARATSPTTSGFVS